MLAYALASAVVLVLPIEPYLVGYAVLYPQALWLWALAAAAVHVAGKMLYFWLGDRLLVWLHMERHAQLNEKWAVRWQAIQRQSERMPWLMWVVTFASASVSLPPFAPMSLLAPAAGMRWWSFFTAALAGRWLRFWLVMAVPGLLPGV